MKYKHIKGLQYHKPRFVGIDKAKYQNLLNGKDVVLNEKDIEALDSLGIKYKKVEKKVMKKEEK
tara:strand:+ start:394 stop:585 length:192 start_codon:yes stop_codon:yes gene_type:complete